VVPLSGAILMLHALAFLISESGADRKGPKVPLAEGSDA
jgi:hypothetical protein